MRMGIRLIVQHTHYITGIIEIIVNWKKEFQVVADRNKNTTLEGDVFVGRPSRDRWRTFLALIQEIYCLQTGAQAFPS